MLKMILTQDESSDTMDKVQSEVNGLMQCPDVEYGVLNPVTGIFDTSSESSGQGDMTNDVGSNVATGENSNALNNGSSISSVNIDTDGIEVERETDGCNYQNFNTYNVNGTQISTDDEHYVNVPNQNNTFFNVNGETLDKTDNERSNTVAKQNSNANVTNERKLRVDALANAILNKIRSLNNNGSLDNKADIKTDNIKTDNIKTDNIKNKQNNNNIGQDDSLMNIDEEVRKLNILINEIIYNTDSQNSNNLCPGVNLTNSQDYKFKCDENTLLEFLMTLKSKKMENKVREGTEKYTFEIKVNKLDHNKKLDGKKEDDKRMVISTEKNGGKQKKDFNYDINKAKEFLHKIIDYDEKGSKRMFFDENNFSVEKTVFPLEFPDGNDKPMSVRDLISSFEGKARVSKKNELRMMADKEEALTACNKLLRPSLQNQTNDGSIPSTSNALQHEELQSFQSIENLRSSIPSTSYALQDEELPPFQSIENLRSSISSTSYALQHEELPPFQSIENLRSIIQNQLDNHNIPTTSQSDHETPAIFQSIKELRSSVQSQLNNHNIPTTSQSDHETPAIFQSIEELRSSVQSQLDILNEKTARKYQTYAPINDKSIEELHSSIQKQFEYQIMLRNKQKNTSKSTHGNDNMPSCPLSVSDDDIYESCDEQENASASLQNPSESKTSTENIIKRSSYASRYGKYDDNFTSFKSVEELRASIQKQLDAHFSFALLKRTQENANTAAQSSHNVFLPNFSEDEHVNNSQAKCLQHLVSEQASNDESANFSIPNQSDNESIVEVISEEQQNIIGPAVNNEDNIGSSIQIQSENNYQSKVTSEIQYDHSELIPDGSNASTQDQHVSGFTIVNTQNSVSIMTVRDDMRSSTINESVKVDHANDIPNDLQVDEQHSAEQQSSQNEENFVNNLEIRLKEYAEPTMIYKQSSCFIEQCESSISSEGIQVNIQNQLQDQPVIRLNNESTGAAYQSINETQQVIVPSYCNEPGQQGDDEAPTKQHYDQQSSSIQTNEVITLPNNQPVANQNEESSITTTPLFNDQSSLHQTEELVNATSTVVSNDPEMINQIENLNVPSAPSPDNNSTSSQVSRPDLSYLYNDIAANLNPTITENYKVTIDVPADKILNNILLKRSQSAILTERTHDFKCKQSNCFEDINLKKSYKEIEGNAMAKINEMNLLKKTNSDVLYLYKPYTNNETEKTPNQIKESANSTGELITTKNGVKFVCPTSESQKQKKIPKPMQDRINQILQAKEQKFNAFIEKETNIRQEEERKEAEKRNELLCMGSKRWERTREEAYKYQIQEVEQKLKYELMKVQRKKAMDENRKAAIIESQLRNKQSANIKNPDNHLHKLRTRRIVDKNGISNECSVTKKHFPKKVVINPKPSFSVKNATKIDSIQQSQPLTEEQKRKYVIKPRNTGKIGNSNRTQQQVEGQKHQYNQKVMDKQQFAVLPKEQQSSQQLLTQEKDVLVGSFMESQPISNQSKITRIRTTLPKGTIPIRKDKYKIKGCLGVPSHIVSKNITSSNKDASKHEKTDCCGSDTDADLQLKDECHVLSCLNCRKNGTETSCKHYINRVGHQYCSQNCAYDNTRTYYDTFNTARNRLATLSKPIVTSNLPHWRN